jgi:short-subunit dehydrogenase
MLPLWLPKFGAANNDAGCVNRAGNGMDIRGKVVIITGASAGIGAACADVFRKRGALLSLTARSSTGLERTGGADALLTPGDLTDAETPARVVDATLERWGRIDILINNAGVGMYRPAWKAPLPDLRSMFEVNFFAPLQLTQMVVPHMRKQQGGAIVNVASIAGKVTLPWLSLYSTSKYALCSLGDGLRMELRRDSIHVVTVCPGYVKTEFQQHALGGGAAPGSIAGRKQFAITPGQCAEAIARGVERNARTVMAPRAGWLFVAAARLAPKLVDAQLERLNR